MISEITRRINRDTGVSLQRINAAMRLIENGATIPFISRYRRKETGGLDEGALRQIAEQYLRQALLAERRAEILASIESTAGEGGRAPDPELPQKLEDCESLEELEDLYLQYRPKRQSKASLARRRGLGALADAIIEGNGEGSGTIPIDDVALGYVGLARRVPTVRAAIDGALHIVADQIAADTEYRKWLRNLMLTEGAVEARAVKNKQDQKTKYSTYYNFSEPVAKIPSHRMLAIRRGVREKVLTFSIEIDDKKARAELAARNPIDAHSPTAELVDSAITDSYERLLKPVIQNEVRNILKDRAEHEAITVFEENLTALLLGPPAGAIPILGIEPNMKGGIRLAVVAADGSLVEHTTLRPARRTRPAPETPPPDAAASDRATPESEASAEPAAAGPETASSTPEGTPDVPMDVPMDVTGVANPPEPPPSTEAAAATHDPAAGDATARIEPAPAAADRTPDAEEARTASISDAATTANAETSTGDATPAGEESAQTESPASEPQNTPDPAAAILDLMTRHQLRGIVIGNGGGSRQAETLARKLVEENGLNAFVVVANEAGAGIYAASKRARQEFPGADSGVRSAISIARRLQDPLAELVKIDPKSIGVGQYQHDVDQQKLKTTLHTAVESAVNRVGADLNSASEDLLRYVSGLSNALARAIVSYRTAHGPFSTIDQLRQVEGVDDRAFEQSAGFLQIRNAANPLDSTAIHPESYALVEKMVESAGGPIADVLGNRDRVGAIRFADFEGESGPASLDDIRAEMLDPGRDPRKKFAVPRFRSDVRAIGDLTDGMELEGIVTNVTNFGAFVDIGVHQDGLVHISELSHQYVSDARQAAQIGDILKVKVIGVDAAQTRISLSVKAALPKPAPRPRPQRRSEADPKGGDQRDRRKPRTREAAASNRKRQRRHEGPSEPAVPARPMTMEEKIRLLQEKFKGPGK